jgi:hypothetical protein
MLIKAVIRALLNHRQSRRHTLFSGLSMIERIIPINREPHLVNPPPRLAKGGILLYLHGELFRTDRANSSFWNDIMNEGNFIWAVIAFWINKFRIIFFSKARHSCAIIKCQCQSVIERNFQPITRIVRGYSRQYTLRVIDQRNWQVFRNAADRNNWCACQVKYLS